MQDTCLLKCLFNYLPVVSGVCTSGITWLRTISSFLTWISQSVINLRLHLEVNTYAVVVRVRLQVERFLWWCFFLTHEETLISGSCWGLCNGSSLPQASKWYYIPAGDQLWRPRPPWTWWQRGTGWPRTWWQGQPWRQNWQGKRLQLLATEEFSFSCYKFLYIQF